MLLKGKPVADKIKENIINKSAELKGKRIFPKLSILRVGARPDDIAYEERLIKNCETLGIASEKVTLNDNIDMVNLTKTLEQLNNDSSVHGILVFRPLPKHLDEDAICKIINPSKDIDCMNPINTEKVFSGDESGYAPCTPEAVIKILKHYDYDLKGKNVAIVNRSMVLGRPLSMLFLREDSTVTICHSKTVDLPKVTSESDIVVTGVGRGKFFTANYFSKKSVVIDVGINFVDNAMCGDVNFEEVEPLVSGITPVPGGVGTVTSMILLQHVIKSAELGLR